MTHASAAVAGWLGQRREHGAMLLALDFDGTLAPIAPRPSDAALPAETRVAMALLAAREDTRVAVISGRGLDDVEAKVGLPGLFYAGNHGLEIRGPGVVRRHEEAMAAQPSIRACLDVLAGSAGAMPGVILEDKGLSLSVHYRLVGGNGREDAVRAAVHAACGADPALRITEGKKVVEVRPAVAWDKGRAITFLTDTLLDNVDAPVLFIGDDVTDEDGFRALAGRGAGIIVADPLPPTTAAQYFLRTPDEVAALLRALAQDAPARA